MINELNRIFASAKETLLAIKDLEQLKELKIKLLGKKSELNTILAGLRDLAPEDRKTAGQVANEIKQELNSLFESREFELESIVGAGSNAFDVTLPGKKITYGGLHPITRIIYDLNDAFITMGFEVYDGPEISSEAFDFDFLNFPPEHPARESMDTYWLEGCDKEQGFNRLALRPHLTGNSVRYMLDHKPPFRFVYPGRVFRNEATDASHERAFFQYEALIVDRVVPFSAVRIMVNTILEKVFGRPVITRMRAGFFPFVEPGFEIDMQCLVCGGVGCSVCGQVGWLEVMPGGPPHPNVLRSGGIDPNEWQGAYINIGLDRMVMMKYGINDVRLFHSADVRFLSQFRSCS